MLGYKLADRGGRLIEVPAACTNLSCAACGGIDTASRVSHDSFRFPDPVSIKVERNGTSSGRIKLPKLGWISLRGWYTIPGKICNATVMRRADRWHVAVQWEREVDAPAESALPPVGIDLVVAVCATLSDGTSIAPANQGKKALRTLREAFGKWLPAGATRPPARNARRECAMSRPAFLDRPP